MVLRPYLLLRQTGQQAAQAQGPCFEIAELAPTLVDADSSTST